jgi:hypothetical protein
VNVFVLCTGRSGSTTFIEACKHLTNYSSSHESRSNLIGEARFNYPPNHIEADNRLSWFLGRLEKKFGNEAFYVHLKRDHLHTAKSFLNRYERGIIKAYRSDIIMNIDNNADPLSICLDYCETIDANIELFLKNKERRMSFQLENAKEDFVVFWNAINGEGNLNAALNEWDIKHNDSKAIKSEPSKDKKSLKGPKRLFRFDL